MIIDIKDIGNWSQLKSVITKYVGVDCSQYSDQFLIRRVEVRLRACKLNSLLEYSKILELDMEERQKLNKELTIHVTHFFRDKSLYKTFMGEIVPKLVELKQNGDKAISVWSAGCSTGEEPVSIAICLFEVLGSGLQNMKIQILGTDIDDITIETAKQGLYGEYQFREIPEAYKNKYFRKVDPDGIYVPVEGIRQVITYKKGDILSPFKPKNIDVIFCRNTVIYFNMDAKFQLYSEFFDCLNQGGYLVLGNTEVLIGPAHDKFKLANDKERIYIKE
ncbi:protein-glutamate O-methyltransferase CheR [Candidatus Woesearchaeota archaeon]|nr:protein-glutamate O-methyltransferase CheR [Candidatus Woesearchaeota archaeon]